MSAPRRVLRPDPLPGNSAPLGEGEGNLDRNVDATDAAHDPVPVEGHADEPRRPKGTAHDRALRLLSVRARSRAELEARLLRAGFDPQEVDEALEGLAAAGLIDDERLARAVVDYTVNRRLGGRRAVMLALRAHRVDPELVTEVLAQADEGEDERLHELAVQRAARLWSLAPEVAFRRLMSFLVRRGYSAAQARDAARKALAVGPDDEAG